MTNSFQVVTASRIANDAIAGNTMGTQIRAQIQNSPAPSTRPASSISRGTPA